MGLEVVQLAEALRFDYRLYQWKFPLILSFRSHYGPAVEA